MLGYLSMIIVKDTTQDFTAVKGALGRRLREGNRRLLLKCLMGAWDCSS